MEVCSEVHIFKLLVLVLAQSRFITSECTGTLYPMKKKTNHSHSAERVGIFWVELSLTINSICFLSNTHTQCALKRSILSTFYLIYALLSMYFGYCRRRGKNQNKHTLELNKLAFKKNGSKKLVFGVNVRCTMQKYSKYATWKFFNTVWVNQIRNLLTSERTHERLRERERI